MHLKCAGAVLESLTMLMHTIEDIPHLLTSLSLLPYLPPSLPPSSFYHGPIFWNYGLLPQTWEDPNHEHPEVHPPSLPPSLPPFRF
jgi:hypothetical protein